jgi:hypothetical protein
MAVDPTPETSFILSAPQNVQCLPQLQREESAIVRTITNKVGYMFEFS